MQSLNFLWIKILEGTLIPFFPFCLEVHLKIPELFVRNDVDFDLVKYWILSRHHFKVRLLLVNVIELLRQLLNSFLNLSDAVFEFFSTSCSLGYRKCIHVSMHSFQVFAEVALLLHQLFLDFITIIL
jgi:hypothetical protein